ncbi:exosome complex exonuclease Rrp41 [Candidatus Woesearchaeota archaeon B3_Woes]|nr:MAG: exosome complex exonuclease Rrp41 [Candidatus Woesearchaeota archaeon B3_Woes]
MSRPDKRKVDETRPIEAKVGVIKRADGSAMFKIGNTVAYAAVYGPRSLHPRFLQNPEKGILRCNYNMMPFSGSGDRIRPGGSRRSKEIALVTKNALTPIIGLNEFPNAVVDLYIEFPQTDAGTRCAGICAASMALADAGIPMKEMVSSIAVGLVNGKPVVDLSKEEEDIEGTVDVPIAVLPNSGKVSLMQLDGEIKKEELKKAVEMGIGACKKINEVQKKILKDRYKGE